MNFLFADSFYFLALLNRADHAHERAIAIGRDSPGRLLTTAWVLIEVADAMASPANRTGFSGFYEHLQTSRQVEILPPTAEFLGRGMDLYNRRPDKEWSLTDCLSFVAMSERGIFEALTGDRHFEQAGFRALMRPD